MATSRIEIFDAFAAGSPHRATEQVRSVFAALAGDWESARRVELVLPETGVCNRSAAPAGTATGAAASACCGSGSPHEGAAATVA